MSFTHAGAIAILLILSVPWWAQAVAVMLVVTSLLRLAQHGVLAAPGVWRFRDDGTCVGPPSGSSPETGSWRIVGAIRYPFWVGLQLRGHGRRARTLLILRDAVDTQHFRELCARIEQRRLPAADQPPA